MNALNHKHGLAILLLAMALVYTGCQPASQAQPTAAPPPTAIPQPTATTRPTDTPQPTATPLPTATPTLQPTATPTAVATDIVVAEGEAYCPLMDLKEEEVFGKVPDPEMGSVFRGLLQTWRFSCGEPHFMSKCVSISDIIPADPVWSGLIECVSDEGGVFKGTSGWVLKPQFLTSETHNAGHYISVGTFNGEGLYEGMQQYTEYDQETLIMKYRITKSVSKEQPAATPTDVPTEMMVAEGEANCQIKNYQEGDPIALVNDPELGGVRRALVARWDLSCEEPYLNGKYLSIHDGYLDTTAPVAWTSINEGITDEGGVWKGSCVGWWDRPPQCTYKGEGKYEGLQISFDFDVDAHNVKFRITKLVEEPVLLTIPAKLIGNWQPLSTSSHAMFLQFNPDGTCRQASSLEGLTSVPEVECTYEFEGTNLAMTAVKLRGVPACPSPTGKYEVWRIAYDQIRLNVVTDSCTPRRNSTIGVYQRIP